MPVLAAAPARPKVTRSMSRAVGALAGLQAALFLVPIIVLGQAIGWPASLRLPPAEMLPLVHAHAAPVLIGYWAYLLVSLALVPLAFALRAWFREQGLDSWALDALAFLGAAAGILKMLGIVRWLSVMPGLAAQHATADAPTRALLEQIFGAHNAYAGAIGELLGVQLVSGIWLIGVASALVAIGWRVTGALGALTGLLFATCIRTALPEWGALSGIAAPIGLAWFVTFGLGAWRARRP